jgi:PAS domain S-box-containing protein
MTQKTADEEIRRLQGSINDLTSIQALPAIWNGRESGHIASTLLDVLVSMLRLDFAYARLSDSINGSPVEFVRLTQRRTAPPQPQEIGRALDRWLTNQSANAPLAVPNPAGDGEVRIAPLRLGLMNEVGMLVAGSKRADFPTPTETLLLRVAANQALVALQEARQLHEQNRAAEELERRVADRTAQLTTVNEALRESEKKYRTLFDSIDEGFCTIEVLFDGNDNPIDYRFLEVNPSFEKQTGIQNAQGRRMREIAPQHEEHWFEIYGRIALTGEPVRFENQAAQLHRWYDVYAFRVGEPGDRKVAILFKDITERKQAEAKLLRNEAYLSEAQRLSHTGSFGWNVSNEELWWSKESFRIFGYDMATRPSVDLVLQRVHPEDKLIVGQVIERGRQDRKDFDLEHRLLMPDGSVKYLRVAAHALERGESGELEFVGSMMDITERKRAEEALQKAQAELAHVTRVTTLGELTASIAHEINQPLTAVVNNAGACLRWLAAQNLEDARRSASLVIADGHRAGEIIGRIRALAKKAPPQKDWLDLNETIGEVIAMARNEMRRNRVSLQTQLANDLPLILGDRIQLQQVILNLLINAIEAMSGVGEGPRELWVSSEKVTEIFGESEEDTLEDKALADAEWSHVLIAVRDSGPGLDSKGLDRLFDAFYTTKPQGLGMGLAISRSIIEAHRGRLWATANASQGAVFQFTLPIRYE